MNSAFIKVNSRYTTSPSHHKSNSARDQTSKFKSVTTFVYSDHFITHYQIENFQNVQSLLCYYFETDFRQRLKHINLF